MLSFTLYGGVGEIGGNKVLLEDGDTRFFFDFGTPYAQRYRFFEEYLNPRAGAGLLDLLEMGLLPPLPGIYREDMVPPAGLWHRFQGSPLFRELSIDGVLVSHAHLDHAGYVSFLQGDVPVYASPLTAFILKAIQDTGAGSTLFEKETCYLSLRQAREEGYLGTRGQRKQRPYVFLPLRPAAEEAEDFWGWSGLASGKLAPAVQGDFQGRIGSLPCRFFPVDHSIPGACAFAVETSRGWAVYTGDLRRHGKEKRLTQEFVQAVACLRPFLLLSEGSRPEEEESVSEEEVFGNCLRAVKEARGLVIADFAPRNVERLLTFYAIAQETGRTLVILPRDAYLLKSIDLAAPSLLPSAWAEHLLVYKELRGTKEPWMQRLEKAVPVTYVTPQQVRQEPGSFLLSFSFFDIQELIDIALQGGTYLYSSSEAYNEEQEMDFHRLLNWLEHFDLTFVGDIGLERRSHVSGRQSPFCHHRSRVRLARGYHSSGHLSRSELFGLLRDIRPEVLVPMHTEDPRSFTALEEEGIRVAVPEYGKALTYH